MKRKIIMLLSLGVTVMFSGCQLSETRKDVIIGSGVGAGAGALIGGASGHAGTGAAVGAVGGAIVGGSVSSVENDE